MCVKRETCGYHDCDTYLTMTSLNNLSSSDVNHLSDVPTQKNKIMVECYSRICKNVLRAFQITLKIVYNTVFIFSCS